MAHFAEISSESIVLRVLVVPDEQETRGHEFLSNDLGLGGRWLQTSYNNRIRLRFAGIGFIYDETADVFYQPQPFMSWTLDKTVWDWVPPTPYPSDGGGYRWDENSKSWIPIPPLNQA